MQIQLIDSDDNQILNSTWRYFVASYVNPATGQPDANHPTTSGDMLSIMLGSDRNLVQFNDMRYAGHSLIEVGNGTGMADSNTDNEIADNYLSNPWSKNLILSDEGSGTVAEQNYLLDANSVPTLFSTMPGHMRQLQNSSDAVQFSGSNFILRGNTISNAVCTYGCVTLGSRWYVDANHPDGVLVESKNNQVYDNTISSNKGPAGLSFIEFLGAADIHAGRTHVPALTGNQVHNNTFTGNMGTKYSWNGLPFYSTFIYHSATKAPRWVGYNGNKVYANQVDSTNANLSDGEYRTFAWHVVQTLARFQAGSNGDVYANVAARSG
jgi:hypothetical protein